jgi:hypothetical protein
MSCCSKRYVGRSVDRLTCTFNERHSGRTIVAKEDVQDASASDDAGQVLVCGSVRKVGDEYRPLVMHRDTIG